MFDLFYPSDKDHGIPSDGAETVDGNPFGVRVESAQSLETNDVILENNVLKSNIEAFKQVIEDRESELLASAAEITRLNELISSLRNNKSSTKSMEMNNESFESRKIIEELTSRLEISKGESIVQEALLAQSKIDIESMQQKLLDMKMEAISKEDRSTSPPPLSDADERLFDAEFKFRVYQQALLETEVREREAGQRVISLESDLQILKERFNEMENAAADSPMAAQDKILRLEETIESKNEEIHELRARIESLQQGLARSEKAYRKLAFFTEDFKKSAGSKYTESERVFLTTVFLECREMLDSVESVFDNEIVTMQKYIESMKSVPDPEGEFLQIKYEGLMVEISSMLEALSTTKLKIISYGEYIQQKLINASE